MFFLLPSNYLIIHHKFCNKILLLEVSSLLVKEASVRISFLQIKHTGAHSGNSMLKRS
uniref:Uncharacterized protein n=1 Tax=Arundo donax TaxID=35708 RepID=A0A0A9AZ43_ARUDO